MKIYRILGQKGRITIPLAIRLRCGFAADDVLSFESVDRNTVVLKREKICSGCVPECFQNSHDYESVEAFLDSLTLEEKKRALLHLWEDKTN